MAKYIFIGKSVRDQNKGHTTDRIEKRREEKKKAQHPAGFEPTSSRVLLRRWVLYNCATTAAHQEPIVNFLSADFFFVNNLQNSLFQSLQWRKLETKAVCFWISVPREGLNFPAFVFIFRSNLETIKSWSDGQELIR